MPSSTSPPDETASLSSLGVHANGEVTPRTESPRGPIAAASATTKPKRGSKKLHAIATTAAVWIRELGKPVRHHQRMANRLTSPGR